jgi:hypothetical protein
LLMHSQSQINHQGIQLRPMNHYFWLAFFFLCVASLREILYVDHFAGSCGFVYVYLGQNLALLSPVSISWVSESKNYKRENTGAGHIFY